MKAITIVLCSLLLVAIAAAYDDHESGSARNASISASHAEDNETAVNESASTTREEIRQHARELRDDAKAHRQDVLERAKEQRDEMRHELKDRDEEASIVSYDYAIEKASLEINATVNKLVAMGINTSALEQKRDEFLALTVELQNATNETDVHSLVQELKDKVKDFRDEAKALAGNRSRELEQNVTREVDEDEEEHLDEVKNRTCSHLENVSLKVFDKQVADAEHVLGVMENNSKLNVTALRTKLDEIKAMRPTLEAAYASCNRTAIEDAAEGIKDAWQELRKLHAQLVRDQAHAKIIEKLDDLMEKVDRVLARASAAGADTSHLDADLAGLNATVDKARADNAAGNYDTVKQDIRDAKKAFEKLRDDLKELLRSVRE